MTEVLGTAPAPAPTGPADPAWATLPTSSRRSPRGRGRVTAADVAAWSLWTVVVLTVGFLVWRTMPSGVLLHNDSVSYVGVARNVADGHGVTSPFANELSGLSPAEGLSRWGAQPFTAWPPLYPLSMAAGTPVGVSVESMGRVVNLLGALATVALTIRLARRLGGSVVAAALVGALAMVPAGSLLTFGFAGSESLFMPLLLAALLALISALRRPTMWPVGLFVLAAGAATLTRYIGVAVVATGVVLLATRARGTRRRRATVAGAAGVLSLLPAGVFFVTSRAQPGFRSGLRFFPRWNDLDQAADAVLTWVLPSGEPLGRTNGTLINGLAVAAAVTALAAWGYTRRSVDNPSPSSRNWHRQARFSALFGANSNGRGRSAPMSVSTAPGAADDPELVALQSPADIVAEAARRTGVRIRERDPRRDLGDALWVVGLQAGLYLILLVAIASLMDHLIPLTNRLLLPLGPSMLAVLVVGLDRLARSVTSVRLRAVALGTGALAMVVIVGVNLADSEERLLSRPLLGIWAPLATPEALRPIDSLPADTVVFSNAPPSIYAFTGRPVLSLPLSASVMTQVPNPDFARSMDELVDITRNRSVVIAFNKRAGFFESTNGAPVVTGEQLAERLDLDVIADDPEYRLVRARPRR